MPSCSTYRLTWVSLTLDMGSLHGCSSKVQPLLLTLDEGYLLTATPPDLERGVMVALKKILPETCTCWLIWKAGFYRCN